MKLKKTYSLFTFLLIFLILFSCGNDKPKKKSWREVKKYSKKLENVNRYLAHSNKEEIANVCKRRGWNMKMTQSGLWYGILKKTNKDSIKAGDLVEIKYKTTLLDGTVLYSSDSTGTKTFTVTQGGVESGLEEGLQLMKNGEKARFIIPPYKAHGLLGDLKKIPPLTIIVYYVEVIRLLK
jgi:FKBP-type peptidyl-prolyl cis-trans isomerase